MAYGRPARSTRSRSWDRGTVGPWDRDRGKSWGGFCPFRKDDDSEQTGFNYFQLLLVITCILMIRIYINDQHQ